MNLALWWLSFVDPTTRAFLGVCIVPGLEMKDAIRSAWAAQCNPGGSVMGWVVPSEVVPFIEEKWRARLLTRDEALVCESEVNMKRGKKGS